MLDGQSQVAGDAAICYSWNGTNSLFENGGAEMRSRKSMDSLAECQRKYVFSDPPRFTPVMREQIRGAELLLAEIDAVIERIKSFQWLNRAGIDIGGGALLFGGKGTGKTFFARYVATATDKCARFVDMRQFPREDETRFTALDVKRIFALAGQYILKHKKPVVLFYDEFETAESETIEQLRLELCGIKERTSGIFLLLTSTVPPNELDDKLFRDGRIDIHIEFTGLSPRGLADLLRYASSGEVLEQNIDYDGIIRVLQGEPGMDTPAAIIKFADDVKINARITEKRPDPVIGNRNFLYACIRRIAGQPAEETLSDAALQILARHESGHAVLAHLLNIPMHVVSILPQHRQKSEYGYSGYVEYGSAGGDILNGEDIKNILVAGVGGAVADTLFGCKDPVAQASCDMLENSRIARFLVTRLGYGRKLNRRFGPLVLYLPAQEYSERMKELIEDDIGFLLKQAEKRAWKLVKGIGDERVKERIEAVAAALLKQNILLGSDIEALLS